MPEEDGLIAAHYRIDPSRPMPPLAGGLRAFTVIDRRDPTLHLMAVETRPDLPARPRMTLARGGMPVPYAVLPLEYGPGHDQSGKPGWYIVSEAVPGTAIGIGRQGWREPDLMALVLIPAAAALAGLQAHSLTHRAINPDNLFRKGPRDPATLGPFWAAPPASLQPAIFEPPYMARCLPGGRGDGSIADDVYALGVTLLCLLLGRLPLADLDAAAIVRLKTEVGSYAALVGDATLPPLFSDLLRVMLAEDPDHRPSPALLLKPEQARARRVAARPPRRAQQALDVGGQAVWSARELALAMGLRHERGCALLRSGDVERWLRRSLGDAQLAMGVEELTRRADHADGNEAAVENLALMRCVVTLDPLSPLVWRGFAIQPDGVGPALVNAPPELLVALQEVVTADAVGHFTTAAHNRPRRVRSRDEQKEWHSWLTSRGPSGGLHRLTYGMNPMLGCASPLLAGRPVMRAADLLPALESAAANSDRTRPPIDAHVAAFLAAHLDSGLAGELKPLASFAGPNDRLAILRLFGRLQERLRCGPLPGLAGWLVTSGFASLDDWLSYKTRATLQAAVAKAAENGHITGILELIDDDNLRRTDRAGADIARRRVRELKHALDHIVTDAPRRAQAAQLLGSEIVTGAGLIASLGAVVALAMQ